MVGCGVPVGRFFSVEKALSIGSKIDTTIRMQNIMIATKAQGLYICPQAT